MASFLVFLLALTLLTLSSARTYLQCVCSPSNRGFRDGAYQDLRNARDGMHQLRATLLQDMKSDPQLTPTSIERRISKELFTLWESCIRNFNYEECVNADAALRLGEEKNSCYPNCDTFCNYNAQTWVNRAKGADTPQCDKVKEFRSTESQILQGKPDRKSVVRPSPSSVPPPPPAPKPAVQKPAQQKPATPTPTSIGPTAIPIRQVPPTRTPTPGTTATDAVPTPQGNTTEVADSPMPSPITGDIFANEPPATRNEGCVAVEHLQGYVLQHPTHLRRAVLCAHGFCATPNHAIIVGGELTSMKKLCSAKWSCVRSVKMVNNLKLAANRRAVVNELITVTPYDIRFPKAAVWAVQMLEDIVNLVGFSVAAGSFAVAAFFVSSKISA